ncbi:MAG TPA: hypothetical protein VEH49_09095 [Methylomirabilota bacterium]|jgi:hypothetical protein|nr:hypothetical protein [Methylomirabilota bacterium]
METLILEAFGPFVLFGSILTLVYVYRRFRRSPETLGDSAPEELPTENQHDDAGAPR